MALVDQVRQLFLPGACAACSSWGESPLCSGCARAVTWIVPPLCSRCGAPRGGARCRWCPALDAVIDRARSACVYAGTARDAVKAFKLLGERRTARRLVRAMVEPGASLGGDLVTWVPSTRASESARGFNPAEELARPLARSLRLPCRRLLTKQRETRDSAGLSRDERRANLYEAFAAKGPIRGHILVVDDILTTGATAAECAGALKKAGAEKVSVVTFARAL
ncbi:MAG TPA: ComF family protein [Actinomycetota bacterium]|nr:ComF family protein [Actinomycetota bacterium]